MPTSTVTTLSNMTLLMSLQVTPTKICTPTFTPITAPTSEPLPHSVLIPLALATTNPTLITPIPSTPALPPRPLLELEPSVLPKYPSERIKEHEILINKYQNETSKFQRAKQSGRFPTEMSPHLSLRIAQSSYENKSKYYAAEKALKGAISEIMMSHYTELITEQKSMIQEIKNEAMIKYNNAHLVDSMERNSTKLATAHKYNTNLQGGANCRQTHGQSGHGNTKQP